MIAYHVEKGADITVGVVVLPARESRSFGVLTATEWNRVTKFAEKPAQPDTLPNRPDSILASMGIYVFNTRLLEKLLIEDAADSTSAHDFGKNVIPSAIGTRQVFAYPFQDVKTRAQSYWRDVGTIDAFYEANVELVHVNPELNIYDSEWPIWTYQVHSERSCAARCCSRTCASTSARSSRTPSSCRASRSARAATSAAPSSTRAVRSATGRVSASSGRPMRSASW